MWPQLLAVLLPTVAGPSVPPAAVTACNVAEYFLTACSLELHSSVV